MAAIVLLIIALLPLGFAIMRRHVRTRGIMADVDRGMEEWEIRALGRLKSIKEATVDPLVKVLGVMLVALYIFSGYFTLQFVTGWKYTALHITTTTVFATAYVVLLTWRRTVQAWIYYDQAANAEYMFDTEAGARRLDATLVNTRVETKREPLGLVLWIGWFIYLPIVAFAVNFGIGISIEERYLILLGIGWGALAVVVVFAMFAFAAMIFGKVIGGTETLIQFLTSTFGSMLPASVDQKKLEMFFKRLNIGDEEKYLPATLKQFWYTLSLFLFITIPCLIVVENIFFVWAKMPPFVVVLVFTVLFLFIKTQLKSVDKELRASDASKLDLVDKIRRSGVFFSLYASILLTSVLLVHAVLSALGWWDPAVAMFTGVSAVGTGASTQGFWQGIWKFFSVSFWKTVFYLIAIPGLVIWMVIAFAEKLEKGWGKRAAKAVLLLPFLVILLGFANLVVNQPAVFGDWGSTPVITVPTATQPVQPAPRSAPKFSSPTDVATDDDGRTEVAGSATKRNVHLDEHCRKFGCAPGSR